MRQYLDQLQQSKDNPHELSKIHLDLAYQYARESADYEEYVEQITQKRKQLVETSKSMAHADALYDLSDEGKWEKRVKIRLKGYERLLSAIKRRIETLAEEARGQY